MKLKADKVLTEGCAELARLTERLHGALRVDGTHEVLMVMEYLRDTLDGIEKRMMEKHGVGERELADAREDAHL